MGGNGPLAAGERSAAARKADRAPTAAATDGVAHRASAPRNTMAPTTRRMAKLPEIKPTSEQEEDAGSFFHRLYDVEPELARSCIDWVSCGRDVLALGCTCKLLKTLVITFDDAWAAKAKTEYGVELLGEPTEMHGIKTWNICQNIVAGRRTYRELEDESYEEGERLGTTVSACSERFLICGSDHHDLVNENDEPLLVRRADDLSIVGKRPRSHLHHVAIFGPSDCPLVALSSGDRALRICPIEAPYEIPEEDILLGEGVSSLLGGASRLVVGTVSGTRVHLEPLPLATPPAQLVERDVYVDITHELEFLFNSQAMESMEPEDVAAGEPPHWCSSCVWSMCWAPSFGAEAYAFAGEHHEICLWGRESDDRMRNEVIVRGTEDHVKSMVVTDRYIVAVPEQRKRAYVYSHTGERLRILDEGLDANEYFSDYTDEGWGGFVYSMQIVALGNFLFSSSMKGAGLCVWDLTTGTLLHRFEEALRREGPIPNAADVGEGMHLIRRGASVKIVFAVNFSSQRVFEF